MTKNPHENLSEEPQDSFSDESADYSIGDNKGLFGSAHKLATHDDTAAQLFKELTGSASEAEYTIEASANTESPDSLEISEFVEEHPEPIHKDTLTYDAHHPEETYTANPAYTTGVHIDPRLKDEGIKIPLAPVFLSDRIALGITLLAILLTLLSIWLLPAFYAGNLSNTTALVLVIVPGIITLIAVLCAIPGLITKRHLP